MQEVSQAWKDAHKQNFVPESFVEVTLTVGDPESQADSTPSSNGEVPFSDVSSLADGTDRTPLPYATLEPGIWKLDGTMLLVPDEGPYENQGFISESLCNADGVFDSTVPTITISFSKVFTELIPGVTITWATAYGEYATKFRITAYAGGSETYQGEFTNDGDMMSVVNADIDNYDQIVIEVLEWVTGRRRARIESILVGIKKTYKKADLMNFTHQMEVDPLGFSLPNSEITFEVKNLNGEYNPDNPTGAERYLMERQMITARYGYKVDGTTEWIKAGTFYMSEWETPQNGITATFTARNGLEYMTDLYAGASSGTLMAIATAAFTQAGLPTQADGSVRWVIDSSLSGISAASDVDLTQMTIQEVLQLCAGAACCVFYQDREGVFHIEPLHETTTDYEINRFNSYANSEISLTKQLKAVNVNNGQYVLSVGTVGETQQVDNPLVSDTQAPVVAQWVADYLVNRKVLSGEYRVDPRVDALDRIVNINSFAESVVLVTELRFTFNGAFRGSYEGRANV